ASCTRNLVVDAIPSIQGAGNVTSCAKLRFPLSLGVLVLFGITAAWAAITGSISGVVADPSGAVMPGLTIVATNESTNVATTAVTDSKGFYNFPALSVGVYD